MYFSMSVTVFRQQWQQNCLENTDNQQKVALIAMSYKGHNNGNNNNKYKLKSIMERTLLFNC